MKPGDRVRVLVAASREPEIGGQPVNRWPPFCETGTITRIEYNHPAVAYVYVMPDQQGAVECRFWRSDLAPLTG